MSAIRPVSVRIVSSPVGDGEIPTSMDAALEVQQADGSWLKIPNVVSATITIEPNAFLVADVRMLLTELDVEALKESVTRRTHVDEGVQV